MRLFKKGPRYHKIASSGPLRLRRWSPVFGASQRLCGGTKISSTGKGNRSVNGDFTLRSASALGKSDPFALTKIDPH